MECYSPKAASKRLVKVLLILADPLWGLQTEDICLFDNPNTGFICFADAGNSRELGLRMLFRMPR